MRDTKACSQAASAKAQSSFFKPSLLSLAIAAAALPATGIAQTGTQSGSDISQQQGGGMLEEVVVTGFRRSLQNAINIKQDASSIVDAISAEDIGKLPDTSIAESLARLPGLAGERRNGRTSGISVRGFNENYVATTMNGRELLGIGDNRGVEYDLYPAEIISGAVVYKTPDASLVNQGLGGIVDLQTLRPLENERTISLNGSYEVNSMEAGNPDFDNQGHRLAFTYSDKFVNNMLGFAVTVATLQSPSQEEQQRVWGYADVDADTVVMGGHDTYTRSSMMERDTISAVLQYEPTDRLTMTLDALYIDFAESHVFRGLEEGGPIWGGGAVSSTYNTVENGLVTEGEFSGFHSVIRNDGEEREAELTTLGFNANYRLTDDWDIGLDVSMGESSKNTLNVESYSGVGRAGTEQGLPAARSFTMTDRGVMFGEHSTQPIPDYTNRENVRLAGPQAWGGGIAPFVGGNNNAQDGFVNNPSFEEELNTFRLSTEGQVELSIINSVELGVNYSDRTKSKVNAGAFLIGPGYDPNLDAADQSDVAIPEDYVVGEVDLGFYGLGSIIAYDGIGLYNDGVYTTLDAQNYEPNRFGDTWEVSEEVLTLYGMANFETGIVTGNIGLQYVSTEQSSTGYESASGGTGEVVATPMSGGAEYSQLLPSLNLNFQLTDDQVVRFAASKTASRPRMDDMRSSNSINFTFDEARRTSDDPNFSAWSAFLGNPDLKPIEAIQMDLSYEYYFAGEGVASATYFYKDLQNWHLTTSEETDFSDYIIPGYHDAGIDALASTVGFTDTVIEAGSGFVAGTELQVNFPFHVVSESLDGLGLVANATFLEGEVDHEGETSEIPGLSDEIFGLTVYYENRGFEFRVSGTKRDEYLTEFYGASLALEPTTDQGATLWDAQIGYNFSESGIRSLDGLTVRLQAQNLTDEDTVTAAQDDPRQINKYQHFGANYVLSANYKF